jgi:DNA-binding NarL/FixJ family response regulator
VVLLDYALLEKLTPGRGLYDHTFAKTRAIIILSGLNHAQLISSFRSGGYGAILRTSSPQLWLSSIAAVSRGRYWLEEELLAVLIQALRDSRPPLNVSAFGRHFGLTQREIEIAQKIADGRSNKQVGQDFSIRERTVKHHLTNIFSKLGVANRVELVLLARDHHLSALTLLPGRSVAASTPDANTFVVDEERGRLPFAPAEEDFC